MNCTKVLVPPRGLFASGKFDQYKRDIPYATLAQAFQSLIRGSSHQKRSRPSALGARPCCEALGPNGQLMVELVPELEAHHRRPATGSGASAARRATRVFNWCFGGSSASSPGRSIRWRCSSMTCSGSDAATLDLLEDLLT